MRATAAVVLAVLVLASGCGKKATDAKKEVPSPEVTYAYPEERVIGEVEEFTGYTKAVKSVDIRARVSGYLLADIDPSKVAVTGDLFKEKYEGKDVEEGTILFKIDPDPYKAEFDKAEANVRQSEATLDRITGDLKRARLAGRATSPEELARLTANRQEAEASLLAARAVQKTAALNLGFTTIRAPFSGRLSRRTIDPGNLVKADDTLLTTIISLDPINAYFDIDERTVLRVRRLIHEKKISSARDTTLTVKIGLADDGDDGKPSFSREGVVDFIDNQLDTGTGTLRVRAKIANPTPPGSKTPLLSAGMFVRIRLPVGTPQPTTLVPEGALGSDQGQRFLWVIRKARDGKYKGKDVAEMQYVRVGQLENGLRVVHAPGGQSLDKRERVVIAGQQRIRLGEPVTPKTPEQIAERERKEKEEKERKEQEAKEAGHGTAHGEK